jgi:type IV secretion system protein VirB6
MSTACTPLPLDGSSGISGILLSVDCQISEVVEQSFGRLFSAGGYFGTTLTICLTLYIAFLAYGLMTGHTRLNLTSMTPKVLAMGLVLTFVTAWPAYQTVVYGLLTKGPDEIAARLTGSDEGASVAFAKRLDSVFEKFAATATAMETRQVPLTIDQATQNPQAVIPLTQTKSSSSDMVWASGLILLLSTVGILILARLVLTLLLAVGPLFVIFALFPKTRGLFESWLRTALSLAFVPMLVTLGGSAALSLLSPAISAISVEPVNGVRDIQPIIVLFMGSIIYAAFLALLMSIAFNLVKQWQPFGASHHSESSRSQAQNVTGLRSGYTPISTPQPMATSQSGSSNSYASVPNRRSESVAVTLSSPTLRAPDPTYKQAPSRIGLGQRFRQTATPMPLNKALAKPLAGPSTAKDSVPKKAAT